MVAYPTVKKSDDVFTRFDRMYECDRQTHHMTAKAALDASIARQKL